MSWPYAILTLFGLLVLFMALSTPVAFAFMLTCFIGSILFWGGPDMLAVSVYSSVTSFVFLPIPLFILMGCILFESGVGAIIVDTLDKLMGRVPARLSIVTIIAGALLGAMIGISGSSIAILGKTLFPEMLKKGYKKPVTLGPVVITGTLAIMIPPSALAVFLGAMGKVSIGKLLIAIIVPGILIALFSIGYILLRCKLDPSLAPSYHVEPMPLREKLRVTVRYLLPSGIVIFAAIGSIFFGIASPSEASALGAIACFVVAALYRKFSLDMVKRASLATIEITSMVLMIVVGAISFSRILASSGAMTGLIEFAKSLPVSPMVIVIATQIIAVFMGCFMDPASIVMITVPVFIPLIQALGLDPLWYSVLLLLNIQLGLITPPFGLDCYTMKALSPPEITIEDVFRSSMPFCALGFLVMALIMIFPGIATWLPAFMRVK